MFVAASAHICLVLDVVGFQVKQRARKFCDGTVASELNGGSHPGGSTACLARTTGVIRSPFEDRSTILAWDAVLGCPISPGFTLGALAVPVPANMASATIKPANIFMA